MDKHRNIRVAWLILDMGTGGVSFQPILSEFAKVMPETVVFTGRWPGYVSGIDPTFTVRSLGSVCHVKLAKAPNGYAIGFSYASPKIIQGLLKFKPHIVFANAFSIWTVFALAFKAIGGWKVIITYEGGSPTYEKEVKSVRLFVRRIIARLADAFVINSQSGKVYFTNILGIPEEQIFTKPFLVPNVKALLQCPENQSVRPNSDSKHPIFLYVGQLIARKGLNILLEACAILKQQGHANYSLWVVGDGEQNQELKNFVERSGLAAQIEWFGKVEYGCLGMYFQSADVFVFPTHEDIWGMVLVEAMAFSKPIICSSGAGSVEVMEDQENGFVYEPDNPNQLAAHMSRFIGMPELAESMGKKSLQIMKYNTPEVAVKVFFNAIKGFYNSRE